MNNNIIKHIGENGYMNITAKYEQSLFNTVKNTNRNNIISLSVLLSWGLVGSAPV